VFVGRHDRDRGRKPEGLGRRVVPMQDVDDRPAQVARDQRLPWILEE
jgi:hypothetical protein